MNRDSDSRVGADAGIPVDGHVHFYDSHDLSRLLDAALHGFVRASRSERAGARAPSETPGLRGVLCLSEDRGHDVFADLARGGRQLSDWSIESTPEPESLRFTNPTGDQLYVLSGYQAVTREGLEVLALATCDRPADGMDLAGTVSAVSSGGGIPVLPWAFGKWWFARGRTLRRYLENEGRPQAYLGDNAGRPDLLPGLEPYGLAEKAGLIVLPGSDPLPVSGQEERAGGYGFRLSGPVDPVSPAQWFRESVSRLLVSPPTFGARGGWPRCVSDQLRLRRQKTERTPGIEGALR